MMMMLMIGRRQGETRAVGFVRPCYREAECDGERFKHRSEWFRVSMMHLHCFEHLFPDQLRSDLVTTLRFRVYDDVFQVTRSID